MNTALFEITCIVNLFVSAYLLGLIATVQAVHYPLFDSVDPAKNDSFHRRHQNRITWIVAIPMFIELIGSIALAVVATNIVTVSLLVLTISIWLSTFFLQVPQHTKLLNGFDEDAHRRLVRSNWVRSIAWGWRAFGLLWLWIDFRFL